MKIVDLSSWNEIRSLDGLKGYDGVIVKATQGKNYINTTFDSKIEGAKSIGLKTGAYHFLDNTATPEEQAEHFYSIMRKYSYEIIPFLDIEDSSEISNNEEMVQRFITHFKCISGLDCGVYSGYYYAKDNFSLAFRNNYKWWIASYGVDMVQQLDNTQIVLWQYTSTEQVEGVYTNDKLGCDCSLVLDNSIFNVSRETISEGHSPVVNNIIKEYEETGRATVIVNKLNVRDYFSTSTGNVVAYYENGESFNYNYVIITNEYVWVRYVSFSGATRYVAVKNRITGERYANCV